MSDISSRDFRYGRSGVRFGGSKGRSCERRHRAASPERAALGVPDVQQGGDGREKDCQDLVRRFVAGRVGTASHHHTPRPPPLLITSTHDSTTTTLQDALSALTLLGLFTGAFLADEIGAARVTVL